MNPQMRVEIDLGRIRANVTRIREMARVAVYAVVKADAYGTGAGAVCRAIDHLVERWCVFSLDEAMREQMGQIGNKPVLVIGPPGNYSADDFRAARAKPAVSTPEQARALRSAQPVLAVDVGMQRFACPEEQLQQVALAGGCTEAFAHATRLEQVEKLVALTDGLATWRHASGSSLLGEPEARLDAVRPGLAMYDGAIRVSARLVEARRSNGPAGYSGFASEHHGVILGGYSNGLTRGVCLVNGERRRILEVGMQSAFVELGPYDRVGDEVLLLGDGLEAVEVAREWNTSPQEVLVRLCQSPRREYRGG